MAHLRAETFRSQQKIISIAKNTMLAYMCAMTLSEYLQKIGKRRYVWARECGLSKDAVYRHTSGKPITYETAEQISAATGGLIPVIEIYKTGRSKT